MRTKILIALLFITSQAAGQIINPKETAKRKAEDRTNRGIDRTMDKGLDKVEEGIGSIFKKKKKKEPSSSDPAESETTSKLPKATKTPAPGDETDFSDYKGSGFVPGNNVLFFEDFATARLGAGNANWHMYEYDPSEDSERPDVKMISTASGNWLKMPRKGFVFPNSFKNLPEQFTLEFDLYADPSTMSEMEGGLRANFAAVDDRKEYSMYWASEPSIELDVHPHGSTKMVYISAQSEYISSLPGKKILFENTFKSDWNPGAVNRVSIYRNANQVTLYLNGKEMLNLPNGLSKKAQYNLIFSTNMWGDGMYMSNIRIAGNVPDATREMKTEGRFVTNSIYFDTNSSRIRPESWATLKQTADAVNSATGNILIVGHTDSDGADEANLTLSKKRAESVKNALVKEFGVAANRLTSNGKGESEPAEPNTTPQGKAINRRVEFIKL